MDASSGGFLYEGGILWTVYVVSAGVFGMKLISFFYIICPLFTVRVYSWPNN